MHYDMIDDQDTVSHWIMHYDMIDDQDTVSHWIMHCEYALTIKLRAELCIVLIREYLVLMCSIAWHRNDSSEN